MAILKIYGAKGATCTRRVATILHELKVPFELIEVDVMKGEHKTPEYLKKQPFGQIPYIDDDGFILYESRAICRYIAAKYPESGLIPTEPKANALFEQAASAELTNFEPSASKAGLELMKRAAGWPSDQAVIDAQLPILDKKLEAYDAILSKQRFVAGDTLTLADLFHLPYGPLVASGENDVMTHRPNVARWYNELISRPSWLAYVDGVKTTTAY
ncbi:Glutathione S-transferase [Mycena venus]|uniref:glutathione transferase n=1 Tax=Mycena venus TaxID=2733690 RepID=A0A8H6X1Y0_9AGAR|nr:Glutathione S-transferase [Mycena venus]